jgi:hypothetical protein
VQEVFSCLTVLQINPIKLQVTQLWDWKLQGVDLWAPNVPTPQGPSSNTALCEAGQACALLLQPELKAFEGLGFADACFDLSDACWDGVTELAAGHCCACEAA